MQPAALRGARVRFASPKSLRRRSASRIDDNAFGRVVRWFADNVFNRIDDACPLGFVRITIESDKPT